MIEGVFAGLASFGNRSEVLGKAVESLLHQVDRLGVYLNGYDRVPGFLDDPKIEVARSEDHGDKRDNGKFFFLDTTPYRYYAAADDDIAYPPDYIERMVGRLGDAGPNAAVAVHGAVYPTEILGLFKPRHLFHFSDALQHVMPVHLVGTGTVVFDQDSWQLGRTEFGEPGMADVWFAAAAQRRGARLFVVNRSRDWLVDVSGSGPDRGPRLFAEAALDDSYQVSVLKESEVSGGGLDRLTRALIESNGFAGELTISQALLFDDVRRAVGLSTLNSDAAAGVASAVDHSWPASSETTPDEKTAYQAIMVGVLAGSVAASDAITAVSMLRRLADRAQDRNFRRSLPFPLRFDTREPRLERLTREVLTRAGGRSSEDMRRVWPILQESGLATLQDAIDAERAGVSADLLEMDQLARIGARNPDRAVAWLHSYHEARRWTDTPAVLRWRMILGDSFHELETQLLLGVAAARAGHLQMASRVVESARVTWPGDPEVRLLDAMVRSSSMPGPRAKVETVAAALDAILEGVGVRPYSELVTGEESDHWISLLTSEAPPASTEGPLVSVIMTAHDSADTITPALSSVLASDHGHLEVLVVDDASTDATADVIGGLADVRVRLIRNSRNLGPYASRNVALREAAGEFVTVADADDWSHPGRVGHQLEFMQSNPDRLGCTLSHVRLIDDASLDLENNTRFLGHGPVSLFFRRSLIDEVGGFDEVRTRGDLEFIRRVRARFGDGAIARLGAPLILASSSPSSNSRRYSADALDRYRRAARQWHLENLRSERLFVGLDNGRAPFVAPAELLASP